ncbi:toll-like receptor Tollo [Diorhabda sublineata]|uniref:toll-like receptor Tollo n=1 Tax=Diorhabda sublineata TaxID=1163346 RepID=UPI0024E0D2F7|nr:toll-like receptor Tollo [Diorhabda sublineata]
MRMIAKLVFLLVCCAPTWALCPTKCTCYLDHKGRNAVACKEGGVVGPLNLNNVSLDTEVIKITAPDDNMNALTMSPVFQSYKQLEEIHITKSNIPQLGMHFFYGLNKLDVLNLSQNNITQPLDHNFRGLSHLKELYLDDNRIISLPSGTFRFLLGLKLLSIQRNRIEELTPRIFLEISKLRILKLSGNNLRELHPEVFKDIQELTYLECRSCALTRLNDEVYHLLPDLIHLDLGNNEIKNISQKELKDLQSLRHLKLDGNLIYTLDDNAFAAQGALKKLNLAKNKIYKISQMAFSENHNLTELDVSYNRIDDLEFLKPLYDNLEKLILNGNHLKIEALNDLILLNVLKELRIADCGLAQLDNEIIPKTVQILDLSENYLSNLNKNIFPDNLTLLDISGNRFSGLEEDLLLVLDHVPNLKLNHNLWSCDLCHIVPLLDRINKSVAFREVICAAPYSVKGKTLERLQRSELTWCNSPSYTASDANFFSIGEDGKVGIIAASTSIFLLFLTAVAIIGALCYANRHAAKYYTHEDKITTIEGESIFGNNQSPLFSDGELNFKFPLDCEEKKISIATIDEIKKEHSIINGT